MKVRGLRYARLACSCGESVEMSPANYHGSQVTDFSYLTLFNCKKCGSTRAFAIWEAAEEEEIADAAE